VKTFFVSKVEEAIREKNEDYRRLAGGEIRAFHPPTQRGGITQVSLTEKISQIKGANLVIMNITPKRIDEQYYINSGVLIEYGFLIGLNELHKLSLFCENVYP